MNEVLEKLKELRPLINYGKALVLLDEIISALESEQPAETKFTKECRDFINNQFCKTRDTRDTEKNIIKIGQYFEKSLDIIDRQAKEIERWKSMCLYNKTMADKRVAENAELKKALQKIRDEEGKVCNDYENCEHTACRSSYNSWAIADKTLKDNE
ncbi:MAG: hypothetical protein WDA13_03935 [Candidatus Shapirobacteria bacterium]